MSMAASEDGLFGHFPPWGNQGAKGKSSSRSSPNIHAAQKNRELQVSKEVGNNLAIRLTIITL
jgi:hypothetical protein